MGIALILVLALRCLWRQYFVRKNGIIYVTKWNLLVAITGVICYNDENNVPQDGKEKFYGKEAV